MIANVGHATRPRTATKQENETAQRVADIYIESAKAGCRPVKTRAKTELTTSAQMYLQANDPQPTIQWALDDLRRKGHIPGFWG